MTKWRWIISRALIRAGWKLAGFHVSPGRIYVPGRGELDL